MKPSAGQHPESSDREVLAGLVERVTFHNPENGFCVLRTKARGHRDLVTVVGHAAMVGPGEWITASGEWVNDRTHGQQFKARFMRTSEPSSVEGIEKYLGSGMIRGIGPVYARQLVRAFPDLSRPEGDSDFYFVPAEDPETAAARIVELVKTRIPQRFGFDAMQDIQVLCPMNRGGAGARSLNIELQAALNPAGERKVERFGWTFAPGDKVMQIENDYDKEVYNGDIGLVADVDPDAGELTARFEGRDLVYGFGELDTLVPAYAATVHKSQGSEYPAVVIPVLTQQYAMLRRNLLYTGVTRGKRLVVLVGQKKAVAIAVRNASGRRRWSKLPGCARSPSATHASAGPAPPPPRRARSSPGAAAGRPSRNTPRAQNTRPSSPSSRDRSGSQPPLSLRRRRRLRPQSGGSLPGDVEAASHDKLRLLGLVRACVQPFAVALQEPPLPALRLVMTSEDAELALADRAHQCGRRHGKHQSYCQGRHRPVPRASPFPPEKRQRLPRARVEALQERIARFHDITAAIAFCRTFFPWYNTEHRHGGIAMLTPDDVHHNRTQSVLEQRGRTLQAVWTRHPERFVRGIPQPDPLPQAVWINPPVPPTTGETAQ